VTAGADGRPGSERSSRRSGRSALLFGQGQIASLFVLAGLSAGLALFGWKRFGRDPRFTVAGLVAASAVPQGYVVWLSGGETTHELDRLSIVTAVSVRIGLWIVLAVAVDRLVVARTKASAGPRAESG
jgi:Kef-type K+ transport system membrane component KefB